MSCDYIPATATAYAGPRSRSGSQLANQKYIRIRPGEPFAIVSRKMSENGEAFIKVRSKPGI